MNAVARISCAGHWWNLETNDIIGLFGALYKEMHRLAKFQRRRTNFKSHFNVMREAVGKRREAAAE